MTRKYSPEFKLSVLKEFEDGTPVSALVEKHGVRDSMIYHWRKNRKKLERAAQHKVEADPVKQAAVAELNAGGNATEIAKRLGVTASSLYNWRKKKGNGKPMVKRKKKSKAVVVHKSKKGDGVAVVVPPFSTPIGIATKFLVQMDRELYGAVRAGRLARFDRGHHLGLLALLTLTEKGHDED